ncbi:MAG: tRNA lysidine(34) synthetase TilS [Prevotella sp.]|nr:tRNA lysidine(34) synthetase TilS [Prevotella sp.]
MPKDVFLKKIVSYSDANHLLDPQKKYLVALSGGADSVALLVALLELGYQLEGVHCNFHLRGDESDRDEVFCKTLCERLSVMLHIAHFATIEYAKDHKISIEMAARDLRYDYFEKLRLDVGADDIAVAHHRDDSVETVLLNLIRGTGIRGLTGIAPRRGHIIRPLLGVGRSDIEDFLLSRNQTYITDSSNLHDDAMRNKVRLNVIPSMREINPSVAESIFLTSTRLNEALDIFEQTMNETVANASVPSDISERMVYSVDKIKDEYTLFYILRPFGFLSTMIQDIYNRLQSLDSGAVFISATHELLIDRGKLLIQPIQNRSIRCRFPLEGKYIVNDKWAIRISLVDNNEHFNLSRESSCACLDASMLSFPLYLRNTNSGDRFHPLGMSGSKLVSDFLTDQKINLFDKRQQWILTDSEGKILWVVGRRIDHHCRVTKATQEVVVIELLPVVSQPSS